MTDKKHGSVAKYVLFQESGVLSQKMFIFWTSYSLIFRKKWTFTGGGGAKAFSWEGNIEAGRDIGLSIIYMYVKKAL